MNRLQGESYLNTSKTKAKITAAHIIMKTLNAANTEMVSVPKI